MMQSGPARVIPCTEIRTHVCQNPNRLLLASPGGSVHRRVAVQVRPEDGGAVLCEELQNRNVAALSGDVHGVADG